MTNIVFHIKKTVPLICAWVMIAAFQFNAAPGVAQQAKYSGHPRTIGHDFLDLEKPFGAGAKHHAVLNGLINRALASVPVRQSYTTEEAVQTLLAIDALLKSEGFVFHNNYLLSAGLQSKKIDCDSYCALYVSIAEVLRLPIIPVYAPDHSFVRFNFDDASYLNWEPLEAVPLQDAYYIQKMRIPSESVKKGVYLKSLTRREFLGVQYNNVGAYLLTRSVFKDSISYFSMAIDLYPLFSSAWHNRGSARYALRLIKEAQNDLLKAISLDPSRAATRNTLGDIYFDLEDYKNALREYSASIKLDPGNYVPYHSTGMVLRAMGRENDAQKWLKKAEEIKGGPH